MDSDTDTDFEERAAASVTCIFSKERLRASAAKIKELDKKLGDELDAESEYQEEIIEIYNLYTWIQFKLKNYKKARESNDEALNRTDWKNITSVVSRAYILWRDGDEIGAKDCLAKVEVLKRSSEGEYLMTEVEAEMAYAYSRLGGAENLTKAIELYTNVVIKKPDKYFWKYRLGLAYRRSTHGNISTLMKSKDPIIELAKNATELLFEVSENSPQQLLRARALSQLAVMRIHIDRFLKETNCNDIFRDKDAMYLIREALKCGSEDAKTLSECGRILRHKNLEEATRLLEKSLGLKKNSTTYHHLGLCYERQAKNEAGFLRNAKDQPIITCPSKAIPLNKTDVLVVKATDCYRKAIEISCDNNNPARYSLGLILRECGDLEGAITEFNQIIHLNSKKRVPGIKRVKGNKQANDYFIPVTCAYEQAGLCLLELAKNGGKTKEEIKNFNEEGEKKLMKAVSLANTLSNLESEMDRYKVHIWNSFKTLERKYEELKDSPQAIKKYISLLMRVSEYEKVPAVIEHLRSLSEDDLSDPVVIKSGLESYLKLRKYESAFAFLNFIITSQSSNDGLLKLELTFLKVRLTTAASRLQTNEGDARIILKPLFEYCMEKGIRRSEDDHHGAEILGVPEAHDQDIQDVLILYDRSKAEASDDLTIKVKKLQRMLLEVFGLEASLIDERISPGHLQLNEELKEMSRARVVLILLSMEPMSSCFKSLLDFIPTLIKDCREEGRPEPDILIGLLEEKTKVVQMLKRYRRVSLWELLGRMNDVLEEEEEEDATEPNVAQSDVALCCPPDLSGNQEVQGFSVGEGPQNPLRSDLVHNPERNGQGVSSGEFDDCVMAQMSLFCALIDKEWPHVKAGED